MMEEASAAKQNSHLKKATFSSMHPFQRPSLATALYGLEGAGAAERVDDDAA